MIRKVFSILFAVFVFMFFTSVKTFAVGEYGPNWGKNNITVYIPNDSAYSSTMLHAFQKWQSKCYGQLTFTMVNKTPADIEVEFASKTDGTDGEIGSYSLMVQGGNITSAKITIAPKPQTNSNQLIYTVMLHEIGHALGLKDSRRNLGIMHSPVNATQDIISNDIVKLFRLNGWSYMNKGTTDLRGNFVHF